MRVRRSLLLDLHKRCWWSGSETTICVLCWSCQKSGQVYILRHSHLRNKTSLLTWGVCGREQHSKHIQPSSLRNYCNEWKSCNCKNIAPRSGDVEEIIYWHRDANYQILLMQIGVWNLCHFVGMKHCSIKVRKPHYYLILQGWSLGFDCSCVVVWCWLCARHPQKNHLLTLLAEQRRGNSKLHELRIIEKKKKNKKTLRKNRFKT